MVCEAVFGTSKATMGNERNASVVSAGGTRHTVNEHSLNVTSVFTKRGEHAVIDHAADADEEVLVALGYKQEFKRYSFYRELSQTPDI